MKRTKKLDTTKLTKPMVETLLQIASHERAGKTGASLDVLPQATFRALERRGLVAYRVHHGVSLTDPGWRHVREYEGLSAALATRPDGRTVTVTIPQRDEDRGRVAALEIHRLASAIVAAANALQEESDWTILDLDITLGLQPDPSEAFWQVSLGRDRFAARTVTAALTGLLATFTKGAA